MSLPDTSTTQDRYELDALLQAWERAEGARHAQVLISSDTLAACTLADLARRLAKPILIVTSSTQSARSLEQAMEVFAQASDDPFFFEGEDAQPDPYLDEVCVFPEVDLGPYHHASADRRLAMQRLSTLYRMQRPQTPRVSITSVRALMRRTLSPDTMRAYSRELREGDEITNRDLRTLLAHCGYMEVPVVEDPGTFAIRGDIVDIYSPLDLHPTRIERWGDEVAEIRLFHEETQRTIEPRDVCHIFPVRSEILNEQSASISRDRLLSRAGDLKLPTSTAMSLINDIKAGIHFVGISALLPALHEQLATLLDYIPEETVIVLQRPDAISVSSQELWNKREAEAAYAATQDQVFFEPSAYYTPAQDMIARLRDAQERLDVRQIAILQDVGPLSFNLPEEDMTFVCRARENGDVVALRKSSHSVEHMVKALAEKIKEWSEDYGRVCFTCRTQAQVDRLVELLSTFYGDAMELPTPIDVSEPVPPPAMVCEVYLAPLKEGFRSQMLGLCLISGAEVFGKNVRAQTDQEKFSEQAAISHFKDLTMGDLVVHIDFGIGRYKGLRRMDVDGIATDLLQLEYAGGDQLYIPVYSLGRVQKYVGSTDGVRLDKLGSTSWERTKDKVKANIRAIAGELITLYARREMAKGFAYDPPNKAYREFEELFPFEETPDQQRAIDESIADMVSNKPMDRLICGDVGFGKTEVAMRAAFLAAQSGKQVAVLVPTTILAEQHGVSFKQRMASFGVIVECLSRFRTSKESSDIIERTKQGKIDVLVGTHRLLNNKIKFPNLGLLIVDEEQRFGVTHKEKIKKLKNNIDVLTLSATPIPRTLQMSLMGIRDLTIISTPPTSRLAVRTHVAKYNDGVVREAIERELARGGQVFFVHNRVRTMPEIYQHLTELVPHAKIGVGHGQMSETDLERVMVDYVKGEINVLLCSSIIESGLDIPNANTIILNRADMFGLSQLYQLRGRVGRGKERAYAYLLIPARGKLKKDAEKRLDVIQTHTELGSGFHVASYDLEIRGAGSMLGDDQSGHVAAVGLDLYNELLEEAVSDLRGEDPQETLDPEVNIAVPSFMPDDYIPATSLRLVFYKRFSLAQTMGELDVVYQEMRDRFGTPPDSVRNLYDIVAIKVGLRQIRARRLDAGPSAVSVELTDEPAIDPGQMLRLVKESRGRLRLTESMKIVLHLKPDEAAQPLKTSRKLVDMLLAAI